MGKTRRYKGGQCSSETGGAAAYASNLYGAGPDQHSVPGGGNLIAMKTGGGKKYQKRGGTTFTDLAVPAVLLYAQQATVPSRKGRSRRTRKSRRSSSRLGRR